MKFNLITIFPDYFQSPLKVGVVGQALGQGLLHVNFVNPRDFTEDVHRTVDDRPFGGGDGMLMLVEPLKRALTSLSKPGRVVYLSPHGTPWSDAKARAWAEQGQDLTLVCGRYAGIDQRFIQNYVEEEISLGDFVLSGGEPAALAIIDSVARFLPGVLGNDKSPEEESFAKGILEAPQFTRPREFEGEKVPEILLGGHHARIQEWRETVALLVTALRRPDLVVQNSLQNQVRQAAEQALNWNEDELNICGIRKEQLEDLLNDNP